VKVSASAAAGSLVPRLAPSPPTETLAMAVVRTPLACGLGPSERRLEAMAVGLDL